MPSSHQFRGRMPRQPKVKIAARVTAVMLPPANSRAEKALRHSPAETSMPLATVGGSSATATMTPHEGKVAEDEAEGDRHIGPEQGGDDHGADYGSRVFLGKSDRGHDCGQQDEGEIVAMELGAVGDARVDLLAADRGGAAQVLRAVLSVRCERARQDRVEGLDEHHQTTAVGDALVECVEGDSRALRTDHGTHALAEATPVLDPGLRSELGDGFLSLAGQLLRHVGIDDLEGQPHSPCSSQVGSVAERPFRRRRQCA